MRSENDIAILQSPETAFFHEQKKEIKKEERRNVEFDVSVNHYLPACSCVISILISREMTVDRKGSRASKDKGQPFTILLSNYRNPFDVPLTAVFAVVDKFLVALTQLNKK